jgi:hypothetical protein
MAENNNINGNSSFRNMGNSRGSRYDVSGNLNNLNSNTNILYIILAIIFLIVLVIIIVVLVRRAKKNKTNVSVLLGAPADAFDLKNQSFSVKNSDEGLEFSYSVWIYIQDWTQGWKNIFVKGSKSGQTGGSSNSSRAPGLWLYPDTNALHARINTFASPNEGCDIKNIPLQKWVHITYVLNNRTVDIYIDGKLERSCVLRGVPKLNDDQVHICDNGGFFGKISNLVYFRYALKPDEVYKIYASGPY